MRLRHRIGRRMGHPTEEGDLLEVTSEDHLEASSEEEAVIHEEEAVIYEEEVVTQEEEVLTQEEEVVTQEEEVVTQEEEVVTQEEEVEVTVIVIEARIQKEETVTRNQTIANF